jgi:hypothetical protein
MLERLDTFHAAWAVLVRHFVLLLLELANCRQWKVLDVHNTRAMVT